MIRFADIKLVQIKRVGIAFVTCVLATYLLSCIVQSISVLVELEKVGADISAIMWVRTIVHDIYGLTFKGYVPYFLTILNGFIIAMPAAALTSRYLPLPAILIYSVAGAVAMMTIMYIAKASFYDLYLWVGTRGIFGYVAQVFVGGLGSGVFAVLSKQPSVQSGKETSHA